MHVTELESGQAEHHVGILLYDDADNYVEAALAFDETENGKIILVDEQHATAETTHKPVKLKTPFWIRATKVGKHCLAELSFDGETFTSYGRCEKETPTSYVGFVARSTSEEATAKITLDSFEFLAKSKE